MAVAVHPGSDANVREVSEMLDTIASTRLHDLLYVWCDGTIRSIDYHHGPTGRGADYASYDPWRSEKIDR